MSRDSEKLGFMNKYLDIDASAVKAMMANEKIHLIDVRNLDEVVRGILPSAIHIPLSLIPDQDFEPISHEKIIFYCHSGIRSAQAASFVADKIDAETYNMRGGILAWGREGFPFAEYQL